MAIIKQFKGTTPPVLKKGELASSEDTIYLGKENGKFTEFSSMPPMLKQLGIALSNLDIVSIQSQKEFIQGENDGYYSGGLRFTLEDGSRLSLTLRNNDMEQ